VPISSDSEIEFHKVTATSLGDQKRVMLAQLQGLGDESDDENAETTDDAEVLQPLGLIARPDLTEETEALVFRAGPEVVAMGLLDKSLTPRFDEDPAVAEGETRLYGAKERAAMVRLKDDGSVEVRSKDGQAITIMANDATLVINADGDIIATPKSGQKVYLGGDTGTQPTPLGTDLNTYLGELRDAINQLRSDMSSAISGHTHSIDLGSCSAGGLTGPQSTAASTGLVAIPGGSDAGDPPALSDTVENL